MSGRLCRHAAALIAATCCAAGCAVSQTGYIQVWGEGGTHVYVDHAPEGRIETTPGYLVVEGVEPGLHLVTVRKQGCIRQESRLFVQRGELAAFHAKPFVEIPGSLGGPARVVSPAEPNDEIEAAPIDSTKVGPAPAIPPVEPKRVAEPPKVVERPRREVRIESPPREAETFDYTVQKGDSLASVARRFETTPELVRLANRRTGDAVSPGEKIRVLKEKPRIVVHRRSFRLELFLADRLAKEYPVCVGKDDLTPVGDYAITDKLKNPDWWHEGRRYPFGDPRNILGTRWMTLVRDGHGREGYGIHGTTRPESVPGNTSSGCVRMLNRDVEELFAWTPRGVRVRIEDD